MKEYQSEPSSLDPIEVAEMAGQPVPTPDEALQRLRGREKGLRRYRQYAQVKLSAQEREFVNRAIDGEPMGRLARELKLAPTGRSLLTRTLQPHVARQIIDGLQARAVSSMYLLELCKTRLKQILENEELLKKSPKVVLDAINTVFAGLRDNAALSAFERARQEDEAVARGLDEISSQILRDHDETAIAAQ